MDAFRKGSGEVGGDRSSGTGGYALIAESELPLLHDPNQPSGRDALIVSAPEFERVHFTRFRVRPGDDASCLNLYKPTNPMIVAPEASFIDDNRFSFGATLAVHEHQPAEHDRDQRERAGERTGEREFQVGGGPLLGRLRVRNRPQDEQRSRHEHGQSNREPRRGRLDHTRSGHSRDSSMVTGVAGLRQRHQRHVRPR